MLMDDNKKSIEQEKRTKVQYQIKRSADIEEIGMLTPEEDIKLSRLFELQKYVDEYDKLHGELESEILNRLKCIGFLKIHPKNKKIECWKFNV